MSNNSITTANHPVIKSQSNGLLVGIAHDTIGVAQFYAVGDSNKRVFGGVSRTMYQQAVKKAKPIKIQPMKEDEPKEVKTDPNELNIIDDSEIDAMASASPNAPEAESKQAAPRSRRRSPAIAKEPVVNDEIVLTSEEDVV